MSHHEGDLILASGGGVPEGIFYPWSDGMSPEEHRARALEFGRACWRALEDRPRRLFRRHGREAVHAFRCQPRGYGSKRRHWDHTTECGQIVDRSDMGVLIDGRLGQTTCLQCRRVVRERAEEGLAEEWTDAVADEYARRQEEAGWEEQRRLHEPDRAPPRPMAEWRR
jgi:hypothetical protein